MRFMNLPEEFSGKDSRYVILPIEYEGDMTGRDGASKGSSAIIESSYQLEYYDEITGREPFENGIQTLEPLRLQEYEPEKAMTEISENVKKLDGKFIVSVGGDHSVTIGVLKGLEEQKTDFSVVFIDAHADLFYSWNGSRFNHRCVARYASSRHRIGILGLRSLDKDETDTIEKSDDIHAHYDHQDNDKIKQIIGALDNDVYISLDVDAFDPSLIRNTGTPEPGGLSWHSLLKTLELIFTK
ncbi:MAG: arginase family protein, partial [Candidatus Woesearchaeota archaeon]